MNMILRLILLLVFIIAPVTSATQLVTLSQQNRIEIQSKEWVCEWKSSTLGGYNGEYLLGVKDISETSVSGVFDNSVCPGTTEFGGTFKKNRLSWKVKNQIAPCHPLAVKVWFHTNENSQLTMQGGYHAKCPLGTVFIDGGPVVCSQW
jgi:hypothetical protein